MLAPELGAGSRTVLEIEPPGTEAPSAVWYAFTPSPDARASLKYPERLAIFPGSSSIVLTPADMPLPLPAEA